MQHATCNTVFIFDSFPKNADFVRILFTLHLLFTNVMVYEKMNFANVTVSRCHGLMGIKDAERVPKERDKSS